MTPTRPVLRYHGGKWKLAPWIISHMPPHRIYVEPYGGAASVLMRKPRVFAEVYNDLDGQVVNVFRVLRDKVNAERLLSLLELTPFAREEFDGAYEPTDDAVEAARRTLVRAFLGFGSAGYNAEYVTGFRRKSFRNGTAPSLDWRNYPEVVPAYVDRLRGVTVEHRPALEVIEGNDRNDVLFYVDPPYVRSTRVKDSNGDVYRHEMTDADHEDLARALYGVKGMVLLSGYRSDLYDSLYSGWTRVERKAYADKSSPRVECLWMNKAAAARCPRLGLLAACGDLTECQVQA